MSVFYVVVTVFRLIACVRLGMWLAKPNAAPAVTAIGLFFYAIAGQRGLWLVRSGFSPNFNLDAYLIVGISFEAITLLVLWWRFWRRDI